MIIVLNHKSNFTQPEIVKYIAQYNQLKKNNHQVITCPTSCYLPYFKNIELASQDISRYPIGAYTGEISGKALKSLNVSYVLINHSERLKYMNEDLFVAKQKIEMARENNIIPIICVGDTKEEHDEKIHLEKIREILNILIMPDMKDYIIAYEPIYAIGSGIVPSNYEIEEVVGMIKEIYNVPVLYGGSVSEDNIETLKKISSIDGFLLGGISLKPMKLQSLLLKL